MSNYAKPERISSPILYTNTVIPHYTLHIVQLAQSSNNMDSKTGLLLLALFGLTLRLTQVSLAAKWPKCKNDSDLLDYYTSIFERYTESSAVKRQVRAS